MLNPDFHDILSAFTDEQVEYMVVGAYALAAHGYVRATGDLDLWIRRSEENAARVGRALMTFGAPVTALHIDDLQSPGNVIQIGVEPQRVEILTSIDGVDFDEALAHRNYVELEGLRIPIIGKADMVRNKKATGRSIKPTLPGWSVWNPDLFGVARRTGLCIGRPLDLFRSPPPSGYRRRDSLIQPKSNSVKQVKRSIILRSVEDL